MPLVSNRAHKINNWTGKGNVFDSSTRRALNEEDKRIIDSFDILIDYFDNINNNSMISKYVETKIKFLKKCDV